MGGIALGRLPEFLDRILNILEEIHMCPLDPTVRLEETYLWNLQTEHWSCYEVLEWGECTPSECPTTHLSRDSRPHLKATGCLLVTDWAVT